MMVAGLDPEDDHDSRELEAVGMKMHLSPSMGWINDPNGLIRHGDRWHVFYQHNPDAPVHARIHWGHQSSADLAHWVEHPPAFGPVAGQPDQHGCWSGVTTTDGNDVFAVYTGVHDTAQNSTVCVRRALDENLTRWSEPTVVAATPADVQEMRDPFLFTHGGRRFAILGAGQRRRADADLTPAIVLFECDDLYAWRYLGVWLTPADLVPLDLGPAQIWECPQLVELDGSWLLVVSLWFDHVLGDVVHLLLDLVGDLPQPRPRAVGVVDTGNAAYAPQLLATADRPLMLSWVRQERAPVGATVAGCLSLPTRLQLSGERLVVSPDPGVAGLLEAERPIALAAGQSRQLPDAARVRTPTAGELVGSGVTRPVPAGAQVWVDGDVAEIFGAGPATTLRAASPGWQWRALTTHEIQVAEPR